MVHAHQLDESALLVIACSIFIEGHVQGVLFREWTVARAREMSVSGWVRNLCDGRVEIYAMADPDTLSRFTQRMHEGSPASRVDRVTTMEAQVQKLEGFSRRQTG